jgi:hypothetical protein
MQTEKLCSELENALIRLGWKIRQERGNFKGGACLLSGEQMVIINRKLNVEERIEIFSQALKKNELDALYLLPEVRRFLESETAE